MGASCMLNPGAGSLSLGNLRCLPLAGGTTALPRRRVVRCAAWRHEGYGGDYGGRLVDEDMIVLRKRIHEMEVAEKGEEAAPQHWAEWEKLYYCGRYGDDIYNVVAALQRILLSTRPAVALAVIALMAVSFPTSATMVVSNVASLISGGIHLG